MSQFPDSGCVITDRRGIKIQMRKKSKLACREGSLGRFVIFYVPGVFFFSTPRRRTRRVRYGVGDEARVVGTRIRTKPGKGALVEEVVIAGSPSHVR
jgi:hypothetical protein